MLQFQINIFMAREVSQLDLNCSSPSKQTPEAIHASAYVLKRPSRHVLHMCLAGALQMDHKHFFRTDPAL